MCGYHLLKELELTPIGLLGFKWSVVTSGGVALKEVDLDTLGSKKIENLYFAGGILGLDGPSGGIIYRNAGIPDIWLAKVLQKY